MGVWIRGRTVQMNLERQFESQFWEILESEAEESE